MKHKSNLRPLRITMMCFLLISFCHTAQSQVVKKGLVGYWPFSGNADDESANSNDGNVHGATLTKDRFGNSNSAYYFDGNDYIDCGRDKSLLISTNTTNFWFRYSDTTKTMRFVGNSNSFSGEWGAQYYHHKDVGLVSGLAGGSNDSWVASVTNQNYRYADNQWHMFTSTYDAKSNILALYLDGCFVANITSQRSGFDSLVHSGNDNWVFGIHSQYITRGSGIPYYLTGYLDDIYLYNRVLAPSEIQELLIGQPLFDTIQVHDTTIVYDTLTYNDTTYVDIFDTTRIYDTTYISILDTIEVFDTTYIQIVDTQIHYDTSYINLYDTIRVTIVDTSIIEIFDTIQFYDTITVSSFDTLFINPTTSSTCAFKLYPNPTGSDLNIIPNDACDVYLATLYNSVGQKIQEVLLNRNKPTKISVNSYSAGVYNLVFKNELGQIVVVKSIVIL